MCKRRDGADWLEVANPFQGSWGPAKTPRVKENRAVLMLMTIAFLPFAALAAASIASTLKPAKRRPLIFIAGGCFISVLGALGGYALRPALQSGYVRFNSRYAGDIHAGLAQDPLQYWAIVLVLYAMFVLLAGFGFAMMGLCFRKGASNAR
jgi:hypothetical protein